MGYRKGRLSRQQIIDAVGPVIREKGYARVSVADLASAANTTTGKLNHHFPTKVDLFEAFFEDVTRAYRAGPMALLVDETISPIKRVDAFFAAMYQFCTNLPIEFPVGNAVSDERGVFESMRKRSAALIKETEELFGRVFAELGHPPGSARILASITVNAWQGAVTLSRGDGGMEHLGNVFESLRLLAQSEFHNGEP